MARPARSRALWGVRMVEWGILALAVLAFAWVFGPYAQRVHALAERAAVQTTLGALRTALVMRQLQDSVHSGPLRPAPTGDNPFDALERPPVNYAGSVQRRDVSDTAPGQWVFDGGCRCVGYKPLFTEVVESQAHLPALWFQMQREGAATLLVPLDHYVWLGEAVR